MNVGLIILGGPIDDYDRLLLALKRVKPDLKFGYVIAVDGGMVHANKLGVIPNVLLGDFDSIDALSDYTDLWPNAELKRFSAEKAMTDSELAFETISSREVQHIYVIGAFGGRLDHLLGNITLLKAYNDVHVVMFDSDNSVTLIEGPCTFTLDQNQYYRKYVSLVPVEGTVEGIWLKGFKYPLENAVLNYGSTLGVSNEIVEEVAQVTIKKGSAFLINSSDGTL